MYHASVSRPHTTLRTQGILVYTQRAQPAAELDPTLADRVGCLGLLLPRQLSAEAEDLLDLVADEPQELSEVFRGVL